jgi:hypothetical protein
MPNGVRVSAGGGSSISAGSDDASVGCSGTGGASAQPECARSALRQPAFGAAGRKKSQNQGMAKAACRFYRSIAIEFLPLGE